MKTLNSREMLARVGVGETLTNLAATCGLSRDEVEIWWHNECQRRLPVLDGVQRLPAVEGSVRIERDEWGMPHVRAASDRDLFFGFGYAVAQDRLFQLDYLRRKGRGRLAEVLGPEAFDYDLLARTIDLGSIAEREWTTLPDEVRARLRDYAAGVNAFIEQSPGSLPIEFDLLDYRPEPWLPTDCLVILGDFRWYLTGRFPVIVIPELAKRALGDGPLYRAFLEGEADEESMLPPGSYTPGPRRAPSGGTESPGGSNNWVLAGTRTASGLPIVANDPHVPYYAVSIWHEVHLDGGSFRVAGATLAGTPAVMIGRNERVAWGITNNICSQRDLYQERTDRAHPGCFLFDGQWLPATEREEVIKVRGKPDVKKVIRSSRNGPIVDEVLPAAARHTGPVSLRWLGFEPCGWLTALLGMSRARNVQEFRQASEPWLVPTFNVVCADVEGQIGHQSTGRIPVRPVAERGYRPGWDPAHQWQGVIPFPEMPHQVDPPRGFIVTANHRLAPDDYPWPLSGTWVSGHRGRRIRTQIESATGQRVEDSQRLQLDVVSGRARECVPPLVALLEADADPLCQQAARLLRGWDGTVDVGAVAPAVFNVFFARWCREVIAERFPPEQVDLVSTICGGIAARLLTGDDAGWFTRRTLSEALRQAVQAAWDELTARLGCDATGWTWGRLHTLQQKHYLSGRGELGAFFDRSGLSLSGDATTVCNNSPDPTWAAWIGAGYRMVCDLSDPGCGYWSVEIGSISGHPGSPHYDDQLLLWNKGGLRYLSLTSPTPATIRHSLTLTGSG
jgi:penicillin amidase